MVKWIWKVIWCQGGHFYFYISYFWDYFCGSTRIFTHCHLWKKCFVDVRGQWEKTEREFKPPHCSRGIYKTAACLTRRPTGTTAQEIGKSSSHNFDCNYRREVQKLDCLTSGCCCCCKCECECECCRNVEHYFLCLLTFTDYSLVTPSSVMTIANRILLATFVKIKCHKP